METKGTGFNFENCTSQKLCCGSVWSLSRKECGFLTPPPSPLRPGSSGLEFPAYTLEIRLAPSSGKWSSPVSSRSYERRKLISIFADPSPFPLEFELKLWWAWWGEQRRMLLPSGVVRVLEQQILHRFRRVWSFAWRVSRCSGSEGKRNLIFPEILLEGRSLMPNSSRSLSSSLSQIWFVPTFNFGSQSWN